MGIKYSFLREVQFPLIYSTFMEAFADYHVDASYMTERILHRRAVKNAVDYGSSVGVFDGSKMAGFTLIGIDRWQGEIAAFDAGTGIIPAYRGKGIAKKMFDFAAPKLEQQGITKFLLEVLQVNTPAVKAYKKAGFRITRELDCFHLNIDEAIVDREPGAKIAICEAGKEILNAFRDDLDWQPSWENSFSSIERIAHEVKIYCAACDGIESGILVYSPMLNWIMSLVVHKEKRRKGIATRLLAHLLQNLRPEISSVKLINVDHGDRGFRSFLDKNGFRFTVNQFEMERSIQPAENFR